MALPYATTADDLAPLRALSGVYPENIRTDASAVSSGAIVAGGAATAALSLILLMLGTGLGLSSVSPWAHNDVSAATFGVSTIHWVTFTQLVACPMAGCLAGRLRTKWAAMHTDEVYFRDTAHGFLAWAVADGSMLAADGQLTGTPSVLFDAVAVILSDEGARALSMESAAIDFLRDAFGHLKAIAVDQGGQSLLRIVNIGLDAGIVHTSDKDAFITAAKTRKGERNKPVRTLA